MKVAVIGAGNMGLAFAGAFVRKEILSKNDILLVETKTEAQQKLRQEGFTWLESAVNEQISSCQIIILATKPQDFSVLADQLKNYLHTGQIILSIMAGINTQRIGIALQQNKIVRSMPNTPAKLGMGITGYFCTGITEEEKTQVSSLLASTGTAVEVETENLLNAVTALSGSGPAYFYYFLRAMVNAGIGLGLSDSLAHQLACETMNGSYHLIKESNTSFDELIKAVTSKGGTTEAALAAFDAFNIDKGIENGILKAENRAQELSENN